MFPDANFLTYKKLIEGQREVALADSVFNVFESKNVLQASLSNPVVYTDYIADIGLVRRTVTAKLIYENDDPTQGQILSESGSNLLITRSRESRVRCLNSTYLDEKKR